MSLSSNSTYNWPYGLIVEGAGRALQELSALRGRGVVAANERDAGEVVSRRAAREAVRETEQTLAHAKADQREASVWWTFNDGTSSSIKLVDGWTKTAEKKERRIRDVIARDEKLALIKLRGPQNREDVRLMLDVIENGVDYPDDVRDVLLNDDLDRYGNRAYNDQFIRGPFSRLGALHARESMRSGVRTPLVNRGSYRPGEDHVEYNVWQAFLDALNP